MSALATPLPIHRVHLASVDSTNTYARAHAASFDARALTVVSADEQTAGRGRGGRAWASSGADDIKLTFALTLPPAVAARAYLLSPLVALAALRALRARGVGGAGLKWPNDVVLGGARKVGGILAEAEGAAGGALFVALGIGLNVNSLPETLAVPRAVWPLTTLRAEAPGRAPLDVRALADALVGAFAAALADFSARGWAPFADEFAAASVLRGRRVRFSEAAPGAGAAGALVEGTVAGFGDADAALLLRGDDGAVRSFFAGEVAGLVLADGAVVEGDAEAR
jgi:BirA family biotin operon repressor/biotin-[acetyl-CoA-carboxylase] ligase